MNQLQHWISSPQQDSAHQRFLLNAQRVILLLASGFIHLFNTPLHPYESISETTLWVAWIISLYALCTLLLSYVHPYVRQNVYLFVLLLFYLAMFALGQRVVFNRLDPEINFFFLSISLLCCLFFNKKLQLLAFQLFTFAVLAVAVLLVDTPREPVWLVLGRYAVVHALIFLALGFRIDRGRKLRRQDLQYRYLLSNLNDGVVFFDATGRLLFANDQMLSMTGFEQEELLEMNAAELFQAGSETENDSVKALLQQVGDQDRKLRRNHAQNAWVRFSSSPMKLEGTLTGYVGVCSDITDRKQTEQRLRQYAEKLGLSNRELEQFSYYASHDLKVPIHAISSFSSVLKQYYLTQKPVDQEAHNAMEAILQDAQRMEALVDALQIYTSSGSDTVEKEMLDMNLIIREAAENLSGFIFTNDAQLEVDELPVIQADRIQMLRLMQNLIENAIIYRKNHAPFIRITSSLSNDSTGYVFSVEDNGVGIDAKDYEKIFMMFQKVNPDQSQGLGVGLAVCKKIVENHKGRIWLKSFKGRGTTVYFFIPTPVHV